jgi:hypothetical protein
MNDFATLSPYVIPPSMPEKRLNVGDGFILRAIERLLGSFPTENVLSSRVEPGPPQLDILRQAGTVILAGANQLDDNFAIWPGLRAEEVRRLPVRFIPMGIGINGIAKRNRGFTENALETLRAIHEKVELSSWRCPMTVAAIERALPELKGRALMTGCPVVYDKPLLESTAFSDSDRVIAVTVTERDNFWNREAGTLEFVANRFRSARRYLVLHQVFDQPANFELRFGMLPGAALFLKKRARLRALARRLGYEIVAPATANEALAFYKNIDFHIGSRLHAHLHFLSQNKKSFLTYVDDRMKGFSEFLKFPLCTPATFQQNLDFDFEIVRDAARNSFETMNTFLKSIEQVKQ